MNEEERQRPRGEGRRRRHRLGLMLLVVVVAGVVGILAGDWLADTRAALEERRRVDEYLGLGEHTGLAGEVELLVDPMSTTVRAGEPVKVSLILKNKGDRTVTLNGWLAPAPADFESNQLPFKTIVSKSERKVAYHGNAILYPPHTKKDVFALPPGESKTIAMDVSRCADGGRWDMSSPGVYVVELWYETYLTGRYLGVNAWTGMTNHVIVRVTVEPEGGGQR